MKQESTASTMVPPEILEDLKKYDSHEDNVLCLECGYTGKMGIKNNGQQPFGAAFLALLFTASLLLVGYGGLMLSPSIFGAFWAFIMILSAQPTLSCPNCQAELNRQGKLKTKKKGAKP